MKILDDIKQQVEKEMLKFNPRLAEKKYMKITQSIKELFLKAVVKEKQSIKAAANSIGINYSSAKAIWAEFRNKNQKKQKKIKEDSDQKIKNQLVKRCSYKILNGCKKIKKFFIEIKSSISQNLCSTHLINLESHK